MSFPTVGPSTRDIRASLAKFLAEQLLTVPYCVYWHAANALQSNAATWWTGYREQQTTHLANPTLQGHLTAAKGIFSIVEPSDVSREWLVAPVTNGMVPAVQYLPTPAVTVDVLPPHAHTAYELGSNRHWQTRDLDLNAVVRSPLEQDLIGDAFAAWFRKGTHLTVRNYATGDGLTEVGALRLSAVTVTAMDSWDDASTLVWHVIANCQGEFVG